MRHQRLPKVRVSLSDPDFGFLECNMTSPPQIAVISAKGAIILPKAVRERLEWGAGMRLIVEEMAEGVLLKPAQLFARTMFDEVCGILK